MTDKHYAFVDRKCPYCDGTGMSSKNRQCNMCSGTGMVGRYEEVPDIPRNGDKEFGDLLRKTRGRRLISISELATLLKCKVSRVSGIETAIHMPTDKERKLLQEWIDGE